MSSARIFWMLSVVALALTILFNFVISKVFASALLISGLFGDILFYGMIIGLLGFILRKKWGFIITLLIQLILLFVLFFSNMQIDAVFQAVALLIIYLSRDYFYVR